MHMEKWLSQGNYVSVIENRHNIRPKRPERDIKTEIWDKKMTLLIKRRRWIDETTGKSVGNNYELTAEGTRHSVEFAAFLKECFGQIPDISIFA